MALERLLSSRPLCSPSLSASPRIHPPISRPQRSLPSRLPQPLFPLMNELSGPRAPLLSEPHCFPSPVSLPPTPRSRQDLLTASREMAALQGAPLQTSFKPTPALARGPPSRTGRGHRSAATGSTGPARARSGGHDGGRSSQGPPTPRLTQSLSLSPRGIFLLLDAWRGPALAPRWRDVLAPLLCRRRRRSEVVAARA
ncbi:hypothetical protein Nmel_000458 [Mimus melanotis]